MKFTPEDLQKLKQARENSPDFAAAIDKIREQFPGSKITYLKIGDAEFGKKTDEAMSVVPHLRSEHDASVTALTTVKRGVTVGERRRSGTKYRE